MKYVYFIRAQESGLYKIGVSKNPKKRIKQLQTGNGEDLIIIESFKSEYPHKLEIALHNTFSPNKKRGEWFSLGIEEEIKFLPECLKIEQNIKYLIKEGNNFI